MYWSSSHLALIFSAVYFSILSLAAPTPSSVPFPRRANFALIDPSPLNPLQERSEDKSISARQSCPNGRTSSGLGGVFGSGTTGLGGFGGLGGTGSGDTNDPHSVNSQPVRSNTVVVHRTAHFAIHVSWSWWIVGGTIFDFMKDLSTECNLQVARDPNAAVPLNNNGDYQYIRPEPINQSFNLKLIGGLEIKFTYKDLLQEIDHLAELYTDKFRNDCYAQSIERRFYGNIYNLAAREAQIVGSFWFGYADDHENAELNGRALEALGL